MWKRSSTPIINFDAVLNYSFLLVLNFMTLFVDRVQLPQRTTTSTRRQFTFNNQGLEVHGTHLLFLHICWFHANNKSPIKLWPSFCIWPCLCILIISIISLIFLLFNTYFANLISEKVIVYTFWGKKFSSNEIVGFFIFIVVPSYLF